MKRAELQRVLLLVLLSAVCYVLIAHLSRLLLSARATAKCLRALLLTLKVAR
jgi:cell division protein FtsL